MGELTFYEDLLVAKTTCSNRWKMKAKMKLSAMWIASYVYEIRGGNPNATQLLGLGWPSMNFGATLSS